jgi:hypothetical protein
MEKTWRKKISRNAFDSSAPFATVGRPAGQHGRCGGAVARRPVGYWCCYVMSCQPLGDAPAEPFPVSSLLLLLLILSVADGGK